MSAQDIWNALLAAGASSVQAAGIMGNMFFESGLDPEASSIDSNGLRSVGLVQWNAGSYPNAGSLVTGNPAQDIVAQIKYLAQTGGFNAASGNSPSEAGSNFAANYERCQSCQSGGSQNAGRASKAAEFFNAAQTGQWPQSSGSGNGSLGSSTFGVPGLNDTVTAKLDPSCLIGLPSFSSQVGIGPFHIGGPSSPSLCIVSKVMARQLVGGMLIAAGLVGALVALAVIYKKEDAKAAAGTLWQSARNAAPSPPAMPAKAPTPTTPAQTTAPQKTSAAVLPSKPKLGSGKSVGSKAVSLGELPEELAVLA